MDERPMGADVEFLDRLSGRWLLTGWMGQVELRQAVTARWVLGNNYMQVRCRSITPPENPTHKYEAIYHIAFNREHNVYVMHLLDTTEVPMECTVGVGRRHENSVPFVFHYADSDFCNTFTWHPEREAWSFRQTHLHESSERIFATKDMVRAPSIFRNGNS